MSDEIKPSFNANGNINTDVNSNLFLNADTDIVEHLNITLNADNNLNISIQSPPFSNAEFGSIYVVETNSKVMYATKETWDSHPDYISLKGYIYIYSNWKKDVHDADIAGFKVGDGSSYLIDMPFTDEMWANHVDDIVRHITPEERTFWNNKVRCYLSNNGTELIFTTH